MNKEEVLRKVVPHNCYWEDNFDNVPRHYIETAMDEYAKSQCIAYGHWILKKMLPHMTPAEPTNPEADDLYTLFLNQSK